MVCLSLFFSRLSTTIYDLSKWKEWDGKWMCNNWTKAKLIEYLWFVLMRLKMGCRLYKTKGLNCPHSMRRPIWNHSHQFTTCAPIYDYKMDHNNFNSDGNFISREHRTQSISEKSKKKRCIKIELSINWRELKRTKTKPNSFYLSRPKFVSVGLCFALSLSLLLVSSSLLIKSQANTSTRSLFVIAHFIVSIVKWLTSSFQWYDEIRKPLIIEISWWTTMI